MSNNIAAKNIADMSVFYIALFSLLKRESPILGRPQCIHPWDIPGMCTNKTHTNFASGASLGVRLLTAYKGEAPMWRPTLSLNLVD